MATVPPLELTSASAGQAERAKLRRELTRLDTVFFLIWAMVVVDTIGAIAIGGGQALMYGIPILAVLVVLPAEQVTSLYGLIDAMKTVFTVDGGSVAADGSVALTGAGQLLGWACALVFIWVLMASGAAWIMGAGRAQAAACMDGAGPRALGRVSPRTGVPMAMGLVSGAVSLAAMVASLWVTQGDGQKYFSAALTVSIALIVLALRLRRPDLERPFLAPGGRAAASTVFTWPAAGRADPLRPR